MHHGPTGAGLWWIKLAAAATAAQAPGYFWNTWVLPFFSTIGVVIAYTALYVVAFFLCAFIRVEQPGFSHKEATAREQVEFS